MKAKELKEKLEYFFDKKNIKETFKYMEKYIPFPLKFFGVMKLDFWEFLDYLEHLDKNKEYSVIEWHIDKFINWKFERSTFDYFLVIIERYGSYFKGDFKSYFYDEIKSIKDLAKHIYWFALYGVLDAFTNWLGE